jgi:ABC-type molybdate transport system substrate-binding protein
MKTIVDDWMRFQMPMKRLFWKISGSVGIAGLALLLSTQRPAAAQKGPAAQPLLVSAAISLTDVLQGLAPSFSRTKRVPPPQFNLGASGSLQRQIEQGAPVDVFLSAGTKQMDALEQAKLLLPGTRRNLISNQLVLVVPAQRRGIMGFTDLESPRIRRIAIGDTAVPAGDYARQALRHYKLLTPLQPSWFRSARCEPSPPRLRVGVVMQALPTAAILMASATCGLQPQHQLPVTARSFTAGL